MKCFSCGEKLAKAARFCSNCGTNLRGVAVRPTTEIKTEVVIDTDPEIETEEKTSTESLPFESLIIEKFNDPLPPLYLKHVKERLLEALEDENSSRSYVKLENHELEQKINGMFYLDVNTFGDLAFFLKRLHTKYPFLRPTIHMLVDLLFRVYLKR